MALLDSHPSMRTTTLDPVLQKLISSVYAIQGQGYEESTRRIDGIIATIYAFASGDFSLQSPNWASNKTLYSNYMLVPFLTSAGVTAVNGLVTGFPANDAAGNAQRLTAVAYVNNTLGNFAITGIDPNQGRDAAITFLYLGLGKRFLDYYYHKI